MSFEVCCRGACVKRLPIASSARRLPLPPAFDTNTATFPIQLVNRRWVHVCCRGNRARAAVAHVGEQERFATHKHVERATRTGGLCKRVEKSFGVVPIARAVFHPGDRVWISFQKALD